MNYRPAFRLSKILQTKYGTLLFFSGVTFSDTINTGSLLYNTVTIRFDQIGIFMFTSQIITHQSTQYVELGVKLSE